MRREPEPVTPVRLMFPRRIFVTAPGVRLTWEALNVGMQAINELHDAQGLRGASGRLLPQLLTGLPLFQHAQEPNE